MESRQLHHLLLPNPSALEKQQERLEDGDGGSDTTLVRRQCDLHSPVSKGGPESLGSAFTAARPSKHQHIKTMA